MYTEHFHLREEPFSLTPDPSFLYLSPGHAEALAALKIGLQSRRGLMMMTGEVGTGKTTLLYSLLSNLGADVRTAYVSNTRLGFGQILTQALQDFSVAPQGDDTSARLTALNSFLMQCAAGGTTAALVIDEAQNLDDEVFENLRLLSNVETFSTKLLQIILVGQPELDLALSRPNLRQIAERIAVRCHVNPLRPRESQNYIAHRLECAGGSSDLFTAAATRLILRKARGLPRRINILCHNALLFAYGREEPRVSATAVRAAIREREGRGLVTLHGRRLVPLRRVLLPSSSSRPWRLPGLVGVAAVLTVAGVVAAGRWTASSVRYRPAATNPPTRAPALAIPRHVARDMTVAAPSSPRRERPVLEVEPSYGPQGKKTT